MAARVDFPFIPSVASGAAAGPQRQEHPCVRRWTAERSREHLSPQEKLGNSWGLLETSEMVGGTLHSDIGSGDTMAGFSGVVIIIINVTVTFYTCIGRWKWRTCLLLAFQIHSAYTGTHLCGQAQSGATGLCLQPWHYSCSHFPVSSALSSFRTHWLPDSIPCLSSPSGCEDPFGKIIS